MLILENHRHKKRKELTFVAVVLATGLSLCMNFANQLNKNLSIGGLVEPTQSHYMNIISVMFW